MNTVTLGLHLLAFFVEVFAQVLVTRPLTLSEQ